MAIIEIPTRNDLLCYQYKINLEDIEYQLRFSYNGRAKRWILDIMNSKEEMLKAGTPLMTNIDLLSKYKNSSLPPGKFFCLDLNGEDKTPEMDDLGSRVSLMYEESEE